MASSVKNYQCPSCTGPLGFDAETGLLVCPRRHRGPLWRAHRTRGIG
ncbi:MAG: Trm112 family protein [Adlercreutzia equolifaciens]